MKYVIGIDGGGTKAHLCAAGLDESLLFEEIGGGTNLCSIPQQQVAETLEQMLQKTLRAMGNLPEAICIGSAGVINEYIRRTIVEIISCTTGVSRVYVLNDAQIALRANLDTDAGISITAGTGTICLAQDSAGNTFRLSGWGHIFSDEGSAYYIVKKAMEKICMAHDDRIPPTKMTELFLEATGSKDFENLITTLYTKYGSKEKFASLAYLADLAVDHCDGSALEVLDDAAFQLFSICRSAADRMFQPGRAFRVIQNGGIFSNSIPVRTRFEEHMIRSFPQCNPEMGNRKAVWGAVKIALQSVHPLQTR